MYSVDLLHFMTTSIFYTVLKDYFDNNQNCVICLQNNVTFPNCSLLKVTKSYVQFVCDTPDILYDYNFNFSMDDDDFDSFTETSDYESERTEMTIKVKDIYFVGRNFTSVRKQLENEFENVSSESS